MTKQNSSNLEAITCSGGKSTHPQRSSITPELEGESFRKKVGLILDKLSKQSDQELISIFLKVEVKEFLRGLITSYADIKSEQVTEEVGQKRINCFLDEIADRGNRVEGLLNNKLVTLELKQAFRLITGSWIYQSRIAKLAYEKPRGYPGDYQVIELIYDNQPITEGAGKQLDRYFLDNGYAEAVRQRMRKMVGIVSDYIRRGGYSGGHRRILNIGCGSCREIREIVREDPSIVDRLDLVILDQDKEALEFSKRELMKLAVALPIGCIQADVLTLVKEQSARTLGEYDFIYNIGLADYLPDRILGKLTKLCFNLLTSDGEYVFAHKDCDADQHAPLLPDWFCDWKFYPRNQPKLLESLQSTVPGAKVVVERDRSGKIMFFRVSRK